MTGDELLILHRVAHLTPRQLSDAPAARTLFFRFASGKLKRELATSLGMPALTERLLALELSEELEGRDVRLRLEEQAKELGKDTQAEARARMAELEKSGFLRAPWKPDVMLRYHPLLGNTMQRAEVHAVAHLAGLDGNAFEALTEAARSVASIDSTLLQRLVRGRKMNDSQAHSVGTFATLHHFVDGRMGLIEALERRQDNAPRAMARMDTARWVQIINDAREPPPPGMTVESWARAISNRYAAIFPTDAILSRLVLDSNSFNNQVKSGANADLTRVANRYPGLEMRALLFKGGANARERGQWVLDRAAVLEKLQDANSHVELLALDFTPGSTDLNLHRGGTNDNERSMAIAALKTYQRAVMLAGEPDAAIDLVEGGFHTAASIVHAGYDQFASATKLDETRARRIYERARDLTVNATAAAGVLLETPGSAIGSSLDRRNVLGNAEGACSRCRSLLGRQAYYADLMQQVEERGASELKDRRPDLFTLKLDCASDTAEVATLDLVNTLLEDAVVARGVSGQVPTTRPEIEEKVYREILPRARRPFHLPLERLQRTLEAAGSSRAEVIRQLGAWGKSRAAAELGISGAELDIIIGNEKPAENVADRADRLRRRLGWSVADIDQAMTTLGVSRLALDDVDALIRLRALARRLDVPLEEALELAGDLPRALFNRAFNAPPFVEAGNWPPEDTRFVHPAFRGKPGTVTPELLRLLAGLRVGDEDLQRLLRALAEELGFDPETKDPAERGFKITEANLSLINRHIRLAERIKRPLNDLFRLLKLLGTQAATTLHHVEEVLETNDWISAAGLAFDDLEQAVQSKDGATVARLLGVYGTGTTFLIENGESFGVDWEKLDVAMVRRVAEYPGWVSGGAAPEDLQAVLKDGLAHADAATLVRLAGPGANALAARLPRSTPISDSVSALLRTAALEKRLGVIGETLALVASVEHDDLERAAGAVLAALRTRGQLASGIIEDALREARRDALVDWLTRSNDARLASEADLRGHFLVDVRASGRARTTRLAAATLAVQLHLGVEGTYAAWEERRRRFLFPESALAGVRRADQTPPFTALVAELADGDVDEARVQAALGRYLRGVEEGATLEIAGVFQEYGERTGRDRLHLIGVSPGSPGILYHRAIDNAISGNRDGAIRAVTATPWRKLDVAVAAKRVAPMVYRGRPYIFWLEGRRAKYTTLLLDETWAAPRDLNLGPGAFPDDATPRPGWDELAIEVDATSGGLVLAGRNNSESLYRALDLTRGEAVGAPATLWGYQPPLPPNAQLLCARGGSTRKLYSGHPTTVVGTRDGIASLILEEGRIDALRAEVGDKVRKDGLYARELVNLDQSDDLLQVRGSYTDGVIRHKGDLLLLQGAVTDDGSYRLTRIGSTAIETLLIGAATRGVKEVFDPDFHRLLDESAVDLSTSGAVEVHVSTERTSLYGPYGAYLREIFLEVPLHVASRLADSGRHQAAAFWLNRLFNPDALRVGDGEKVRAALANRGAFEIFRAAPSDPHAVAATRLTSTARRVRDRLVANLLAWGDRVLADPSVDSLSEATRLYVAAADIVGPRPAAASTCASGATGGKDPDSLAANLEAVLELYGELESQFFAADAPTWKKSVRSASMLRPPVEPLRSLGTGSRLVSWGAGAPVEEDATGFAFSLIRQLGQGFVVPPHPDVAAWDRVAERLQKIRDLPGK